MSLRPIPIQKNLNLRIQPGIDTRQFFREILMYRGLADSVFPRRTSDGGAVADHIIRQNFTAFTVFGIPCLQKSSSAFRIARLRAAGNVPRRTRWYSIWKRSDFYYPVFLGY